MRHEKLDNILTQKVWGKHDIFYIMSLTVIAVFNDEISTVAADSQVPTGAEKSAGAVMANFGHERTSTRRVDSKVDFCKSTKQNEQKK